MNFKKHFLLLMITMLIAGLSLVGCSNNSAPTGPADNNDPVQDKLNIAVSILPQADLVKMIGGDLVEVTVMIPPGANPDSFEPSTGDLKKLSKADLYIKIGHLPFEEAWMDRMMTANKSLIMIDGSEGIELIDDHDPHIWLSPRLAKIQAETISQACIEADADHKDYYLANLAQTIEKLDNMDQAIQAELADFKGRTFLVYHPAWGYLARDYGLIEIAIEDHGKEPGPAHMAEIIELAKEQGINTVFVSTQHSTRSAEAVAAELNAEVVAIDPLPSKYEDILTSVQLIKAALGGN